jgi:hypothetical protein
MRFLSVVMLLPVFGCAAPSPPPATHAAGPAAAPASAPSAAAPAATTTCTSKLPAPGPATLCGRAEDAKGGAVLVLDDGAVLYLLGLESWPDALHKKRVLASGRVGRKKLFPDPTPQGGLQTQGAYGDQLVLDGASYRLAP